MKAPTIKTLLKAAKPLPPRRKGTKIITGQKTPYVRPTDEERRERVEFTAVLLGVKRLTKTEMHRVLQERYGMHWRSADRYVVRARKWLVRRADKTVGEVRADAVAFYESVLKSSASTTKEKIAAQTRLDEIFGIDAPKQHYTQISGPEGGTIEIEHKVKKEFDHDAYRTMARQVFGLLAADGDGESVHPEDAAAQAGAVPGPNGD